MIARAAAHLHRISLRALSRLLALVLLAATASGCLEDSPPSAARPTRVPPTAAPAAPAAPTRTPAVVQAEWTVLVYLDGDNDLEQEALDDFAEMASVGSNKSLNIVVQFDRISSAEDWDSRASGDWRGVKRFRVERNQKPTKANQLADLGEQNMGDPRTLADFAAWGIARYPARHYALIFWDHGAAWPGVANDDSSDGDLLTLPELSQALADVRVRTGVQKLDLIGFDACLMGQIDVLQAIAPFGQVAIGSADLEPGQGWAWNAWLSDLARAPGKDAVALAPSIITSFAAFYKQEDDPSVTLAAFDLARIDQMTNQLDTLAGALIAALPKSYRAIGQARAHAAEYASGDTDISAIDLGYLASSLASSGAGQPVTNAARALSQTLKQARIAQGHGADHPRSSDLSIYFPRKKKHYDATYVDSSPLTRSTRWDEFLQAFYQAGRSSSARSFVALAGPRQLQASPTAPLSLAATLNGADTAFVSYFVGQASATDPDLVRVLVSDYVYPPGAAPESAAPAWHDGDSVQLQWPASHWYLSNGTDVVIASLGAAGYGSNIYSVPGSYTARSTGRQFHVRIEFRVAQGHGTLMHVWAFGQGGGAHVRPHELQPRAGDTFTPEFRVYTGHANDGADATIAGTPIVFGAAPLSVFEAAAPSGTYVVGLLVENAAGEVNDQYADVTVENPHGAAMPAIPAAPAAPPQAQTIVSF